MATRVLTRETRDVKTNTRTLSQQRSSTPTGAAHDQVRPGVRGHLYLLRVPPRPGSGTQPWRRPAAPAGPPRCAPWRPCVAAQSPLASSRTPPAGSRSGRRYLQHTGTSDLSHLAEGRLFSALAHRHLPAPARGLFQPFLRTEKGTPRNTDAQGRARQLMPPAQGMETSTVWG